MSNPVRPFEAAKVSILGERPVNQDRCLVLAAGDTVLLGLADGLGGHPRGEVAAQLLVDVCETLFRHAPKPIYDPQHFMLQCIGKAHHAILQYGRRQEPPLAPRTTAVLAIVQAGTAYWAHVGDSRLYLIRDGRALAHTRDHSQVRFVRQSAAEPPRARPSLTRCLGGMPQPPTTTCGAPTPLHPGDTLVLCSDGLWNQLPAAALTGAFDGAAAVEAGLRSLADRAAAMPNSDNVTAVALRWLAPSTANADEADLLGPSPDPKLGRATEPLHTMLEKARQPKN